MKSKLLTVICVLMLALAVTAQTKPQHRVGGTVKDQNGDVVSGAAVTLRNAETRAEITTITVRDGTFSFERVKSGEFTLNILAEGFSPVEQAVQIGTADLNDINVSLAIGQSHLTVTAEIGQASDARDVPQQINFIRPEAIAERATSVLAQAGEEEAGINVQRTSPTMGAIVIRGLTGKNVVNFVDGVRFTNGAQRGGVNTFFNLNEPTNLQSIEVLRGPAGAQYGSDSLAGTVNLITKSPVFGARESEFHGDLAAGYSSADEGFGSSGLLSYGTRKFGGYVSLAGRRIGDLRTANGLDSHSAVTRFLGLPSDVLYDTNPETGFKQYGGAIRLNYAPRSGQEIIFHYQRSQQDDGKRFDQLLGGDGNLIADLRNLMLDFGYLRYVKEKFAGFDSASFTASFNSQREERVNQGGQGNPFGDITHQYERTSVAGFSFFFDKQLPFNNTFVIGGDFYHEKVNSPAFIVNPVTNVTTISRPRIPDEARF
ncbi:MAG: TonB-dependent receptor, partial [Pyrinomonadaceae bacterium]